MRRFSDPILSFIQYGIPGLVFVFLLSVLFTAADVQAQPDSLYKYQRLPGISFRLIKPERLIMNVRDLSSPAFEGRELGTYGNDKAANWIEYKFRDLGLQPFFGGTYRQSFPIQNWSLGDSNTLSLADSTFTAPDDFVPAYYSKSDTINAPYTYLPDPTQWTDSAKVSGRIVVLPHPPSDSDYRPYFSGTIQKLTNAGAKAIVFITSDHLNDDQHAESYRFDDFIELPVKAQKTTENTPNAFLSPADRTLPTLFAGDSLANYLLGLLYPEQSVPQLLNSSITPRTSEQSIRLTISVQTETETKAVNVAGYIEGQVPLQAGYVLVTSSFDQEGQHPIAGTPFFGSNDNSSGISVMIEMATIFAHPRHPKPRYSIVFAGLNGARRDFVGARHFADKGILSPDNTIADINLRALAGGSLSDSSSVYVESPAPDHPLYGLAQSTARYLKINLKSDQDSPVTSTANVAPFAARNIPSLALSGGPYTLSGRILDSPDKLNYVQLYYATEYAMELTWRLATLRQTVPRLKQ
jgi:hypothetical protein